MKRQRTTTRSSPAGKHPGRRELVEQWDAEEALRLLLADIRAAVAELLAVNRAALRRTTRRILAVGDSVWETPPLPAGSSGEGVKP